MYTSVISIHIILLLGTIVYFNNYTLFTSYIALLSPRFGVFMCNFVTRSNTVTEFIERKYTKLHGVHCYTVKIGIETTDL